MSIVDKVVAAVTPPETAADRVKARAQAAASTEPGDWLSLVLEHHGELEEALTAVEEATEEDERMMAFKAFAILLTGHSIAEEGVIYPALSAASQTAHADTGYSEQAMVKMQMAALEKLDPMGKEFVDKLEYVKGALLHHMYEEEGNWFPELKQKASPEDQAMMCERYAEEFDRYVGDEGFEEFDDGEE
jgi:hemerythrin superfamily protein